MPSLTPAPMMRWLPVCLLVALLQTAVAESAAPSPGKEAADRESAKPFLWSIVKKEDSAARGYLVGTMHLPDEKVTALPAPLTEALAASDEVYTELPYDPTATAENARLLTRPGSQSLREVLGAKLHERLARAFKSRGAKLATYDGFKVWFVASQIEVLDYRLQLAKGKLPLDYVIATTAAKAGKETGGLETVAEQVAALDAIALDDQVKLLAWSLAATERAAKEKRTRCGEMVEAFLSGDLETLVSAHLLAFDREDPATASFQEHVLDTRNRRMAERIIARMEDAPPKVRLFAVGALHFHGETGLLALLEAGGYVITRLPEPSPDR